MTVKRQKRRYPEARRLGVVRDRAEFDVLSASAEDAMMTWTRARELAWRTDMDVTAQVRPESWASACEIATQLLEPTPPDVPARPTPRGQPE